MIDECPSYIYLATNTSTTVQVSSSDSLDQAIEPRIDRNVTFTSELKIGLPPEFQGQILKKEAKAVRIKSTETISVVLFDNGYQYSDDSSMILHTNKLSTFYIVVSIPPLHPQHPVHSSLFDIASLNDDTLVTIKFKLPDNSYTITINGTKYSNLNNLELSLDSLDTFQVGHGTDLTGTTIESSKPVAVFSGNRCNMLSGSYSCSHLMEQLPPINNFDSLFVVPSDFNSKGSFTRILSTQRTVIGIDRQFLGYAESLRAFVNAGVSYDFSTSSRDSFIVSCRSCLVTTFVQGNDSNPNAGDPYMINVPGYHSYKTNYRIVIPEGYPKNYVTIMMLHSTSVLPNFLMNGRRVDSNMAVFQDSVWYEGLYIIFTFEVSTGLVEIESEPPAPFGLIINGYRSMDSYGFTGNN